MTTKQFPLRVLLTVTTGRLLTASRGPRDNGISDLYQLLGWMTNDKPFTHQLERFANECKPWLYKWFPELMKADGLLDSLDDCIQRLGAPEGVKQWLSSLNLPPVYDVPQIHAGDHKPKNPVAELIEIQESKDGIIIIQAP